MPGAYPQIGPPLYDDNIYTNKIVYYDPLWPDDLSGYMSLGSYEDPSGLWIGQEEPNYKKLPKVKELADDQKRAGWGEFHELYKWDTKRGAWLPAPGSDSFNLDVKIGIMSLLYPNGSGSIMSHPLAVYNRDPKAFRYVGHPEPVETPGAKKAKEAGAVWYTHAGAWVYRVGEYPMRIYPNGDTSKYTSIFFDSYIGRLKFVEAHLIKWPCCESTEFEDQPIISAMRRVVDTEATEKRFRENNPSS